VKALAVSLLALALVGRAGAPALAHPDTLGVPDPYWQQVATASTGADATPARPVAAPWLLQVLVYGSGGLAALLLLSLVSSLVGSRRDSRARPGRAPSS
jgi:hypothetical protein